MQAKCVLEPQEHIIGKQTLKSLLTQEQIADIETGKVVATCDGNKLGLDGIVNGTVLMLSPLQGG